MTSQVAHLIRKTQLILSSIEENSRQPKTHKGLERLWNKLEIEIDTGRQKARIAETMRALIERGDCPDIAEHQMSGTRITGYTLEQLNAFRRHVGTLPQRDLTEGPQILAIQSFKGGVGKTVSAVTIAQYLASQGYRTLLADMDSQGSATTTFGYIPDLHIDENDTMLPYFRHEEGSLDYAIRETYWPNLHLIPSNLQIYSLELELAAEIANAPTQEGRLSVFHTLRRALDSVKNNYDVIVIDSPPALGTISMNILCAADAFVVPTPPQLYDFSSTAQFFMLVEEVLTTIAPEKEYSFIQVLASKVMKNRSADKTFLEYMQSTYGDSMVAAEMPYLSEISNAAMEFKTVLEDRRPNTKALAAIERVCGHVELKLLDQWPSMNKRRELLENKLQRLNEKLEGAK